MITKEYRCAACDTEFESTEDGPECSNGCSASFVVQEFRTPVAIRSNSTGRVDRAATQLAKEYGLSDMHNDRDTSVMQATKRRSGGLKDMAQEKKAVWAPNLFKPQQGWAQRGEDVPTYTHDLGGAHGKTLTRTEPILRTVPPILSKTNFVKPKQT
jgi:DNA-directed RNA polymerase subunit RPC12/RpoP